MGLTCDAGEPDRAWLVRSERVPVLPDPQVWESPAVRVLLAARDITGVYRLLQEAGYTQQQIATMAGQSQPEVSAVIHGRQVMAYAVLARVADGLGIPRGYLGLASNDGSVGGADAC